MSELKTPPIAARLRASVLQQAIQGRLVPQDPADEPASVLLERIREERAELVKQKKAKAPKGGESRIFQGVDGSWYEKKGKSNPICIDEEIPFDIPESWEWGRLGSLVLNRNQMVPTEEFCYIDISSIDNKHQRLSGEETVIAPEKAPSRARKPVQLGDVIYATVRPYLHNACVIDREFSRMPIASTGFAAMVCVGGLSNRFLLSFMLSPWFDSYANDREIATGIAYPAINDGKLYRAVVPVPPVEEQRRIVERINEIMPLIDQLEIKERESDSVDATFWRMLPQSILQQAIQGRLAPQDPADEPASALLERIREERRELIKQKKATAPKGGESRIFRGADGSWYEQRGKEAPVRIDEEIPFDIPESWEWARLESLATVRTGLGYKKSDLAVKNDNMTRVLRGGNISADGRLLIKQDDVMISNEFVDPSLYLEVGQFVTPAVTSLENVGKCAFVDIPLENVVCGGFVFFISTVCNDSIFQRYLFDFWSSSTHQRFCRDNVKKSGQAFYNLGKTVLNTALIPVPPLAEQQRIVAKADEILGLINARAS